MITLIVVCVYIVFWGFYKLLTECRRRVSVIIINEKKNSKNDNYYLHAGTKLSSSRRNHTTPFNKKNYAFDIK